jgi:hypothetical protein
MLMRAPTILDPTTHQPIEGSGVAELSTDETNATAAHYTKQWGDEFGEQWSDSVNFDWYHPPYAYRYTLDEVIAMAKRRGLKAIKTESNKARHYLELQQISYRGLD